MCAALNDRSSWLGSIRMRVLVLALLVVALLIGCGFAFVLVLANREGAITAETEHHLSSAALAMTRDCVHEDSKGKSQAHLLGDPNDRASDDALSAVTTSVLQNERGTEGGFYSLRADRLLGYAFPTHEGPGIKRDIPPIERPMIEEVARRAARQSQSVSYTYHGARDVIVFEAAPVSVKDSVLGSAWVMKRLPALRAQRDLKLSAGIAGFIVLSLVCVLLAFFVARDLGSGVKQIEDRLHQLDRDLASPSRSFSGVTELACVYRGVNQLAESLWQKIEQERGLREQLRHKERLAALGQVAAGVAHELRNPLATIRLRAQMTQRAMSDPALQQGCAMILEEISRLDGIVERLLYFARPLKINSEPFDLTALVQDSVEAAKALVRKDSIYIRYEPGNAHITVRGDSAKLRQVFDNVLSNSLQALDSAGNIDIKVRSKSGFAIMDFLDTGHGIPEEVRDRVFDPFFTTRPAGTGLGLSIAYEIVQAHNGSIEIKPGTQGGTIVSIRLPVGDPVQAA
jgi:signal transduction histidine kinase